MARGSHRQHYASNLVRRNQNKYRHKRLKHWKRDELQKENLDFSFTDDLQMPEVMRVWYWELDRELGSNTPAFTTHFTNGDVGRQLRQHQTPLPIGVKYHRLGEFVGVLTESTDYLMSSPPYSTTHAFEIDWTQPLPQLGKAFERWLECQKIHKRRGKAMLGPFFPSGEAPLVRRGRQDSCDAWLRELAVYRICCVAKNYNSGIELLKNLGIKTCFDSSNWSHANSRSRERIRLYKELVERLAESGATIKPDSQFAWFVLKRFSKGSIQRGRLPRRPKKQSRT